MVKVLFTFILSFIVFNSFAAFPIRVVPTSTTQMEVNEGKQRAMEEVIQNMTVENYEKLVGKKLNFVERLLFKVEKRRLVNGLKRGAGPGEFKILGFAMGLLYGPFGYLVALAVSKDRNFRRSAWLGLMMWLLALVILMIVLLAMAGGKSR